jgi:hypothetical protein
MGRRKSVGRRERLPLLLRRGGGLLRTGQARRCDAVVRAGSREVTGSRRRAKLRVPGVDVRRRRKRYVKLRRMWLLLAVGLLRSFGRLLSCM